MIRGKKNQLGNVGNNFQTKAKRVLCICSAGMLRSPTLANILHKELGYNTRAVGADKEYALIPITQALIWWADEIVFVHRDNLLELTEEERNEITDMSVPVKVLGIEDDYDWGDKELEQLLLIRYLSK